MGRLLTMRAIGVRLPPAKGHPNRVPFCGVLTRVDEPSTKPPGGSDGHRVLIPRALAESRLHTLIGMAVDCDDALENHEPQRKIGIITEATIDGNDVLVSGYLYEKDFPHEVSRIRAKGRQGDMGMSFEIADVIVKDTSAGIWELEDFVFTGAAILDRHTAAYANTAMVAAADTGGKAYKTEAGKKFPASDYAYVPDRTKPSTWKLRLTSTPGGKPDPKIVGMAVAALGKGFRGNKVRIPASARAKVKARVRRAWKQANPTAKPDEMPQGLKGAAELFMEVLSMADDVMDEKEEEVKDQEGTGDATTWKDNEHPPEGDITKTPAACSAESELVAQVLSAIQTANAGGAFASVDDVVAAIAKLYTTRQQANGKPPWLDKKDGKDGDEEDAAATHGDVKDEVEAGDESLDAAKMILQSMLQMVEEMQRQRDEEDNDKEEIRDDKDEEPPEKSDEHMEDDPEDSEAEDEEDEGEDGDKEKLKEELKDDGGEEHEDEDQDIDMLWRLLKKVRGQAEKRSEDMADKATVERLGTLEKGFEKMQGQFEEVLGLLKKGVHATSDDKTGDKGKDANPGRRSLAAGSEYIEYLQKYNIDASKQYTVDQIDTLLRQAGVNDVTTRGAIKHGLQAMGALNGA